MKNLRTNCGIFLSASFFMFICAEILLRILPLKSLHGPLQEWMLPHAQYHHFHKPNSQAIEIVETSEGLVVKKSQFDAQGMRDLPPLKGLPKVILIGDSFVQANQVDVEEMFGNILEKRLLNTDILNIGCSSWSSLIYWNWLKANIDHIPQLKSVFLFYFPNDVYDTWKYWQDADGHDSLTDISFYSYVDRKKKEAKPIRDWLYQHSRLYFLMSEAKNKLKETIQTKNNQVDGLDPDYFESFFVGMKSEKQREAIHLEKKLLKQIHQFLQQREVRFVLVYIPLAQQVSWDENPTGSLHFTDNLRNAMATSMFFQDWLREIARENNFEFVDLTPALKRYKKDYPDKFLYNLRDGHFSQEGHKAVAGILESIVKKSSFNSKNE